MRWQPLADVPSYRFASAYGGLASAAPFWPQRSVCVLLALVGLVALPGCANPQVRERLAARERSMKWAIDRLAWREQQSPARLQRDLVWIRDDFVRHSEQFERDLRDWKANLEFDVRRWQERQKAYGEKVWEILRGKPENIAPALLMFL